MLRASCNVVLSNGNIHSTQLYNIIFHNLACGILRRTVLMFSVKKECLTEIVYEMSSDRDNVDTDRQNCRYASNDSSLVKYGQYMDDIGRNYKIYG